MLRSVKSRQRQMVMLSAKVDGTGTAALSGTNANDMVLTDNGVGDYSLAINEAMERLPEVQVTVVTDNRIARIGTVANGSVQILTEDLTGAAADADFHVLIVGSLDPDAV